jgi:tetratricopeptide (TPR) repeat protein
MNNLAIAYQAAGQLTKSVGLLEQTLEKMKAALGPDHPETLSSMNNLAATYYFGGQLDKARPLLEHTLEKLRAKLGPDHPTTLSCMNNLALAYRSARQFDRSVVLSEETLKLRQTKQGPDHPETLQAMANLAMIYRDLRRVTEAVALFEETLVRARQQLPAQVAWVPGELAATYDQAGKFAKAEPIYRAFLKQAKNELGADDLGTSGYMAQLGLNLLRQNKHVEAEPLLRECLKIQERKEPDAWTTFSTKSMLGGSLLGQKKYAEAEPLLLEGYKGCKERQAKVPPPGQVRLIEALERLVQLYQATDQKDQAATWRKELEAARQPQSNPQP